LSAETRSAFAHIDPPRAIGRLAGSVYSARIRQDYTRVRDRGKRVLQVIPHR